MRASPSSPGNSSPTTRLMREHCVSISVVQTLPLCTSVDDPKQTYVPAALNPLALPYGANRWLHDLAGPMKCSTTGISATVSSVTLSRVSEIIAQQSLTSMRSPSTSKAHLTDTAGDGS